MTNQHWRNEALKALDGMIGRVICTVPGAARRTPASNRPVDPARLWRMLVIRPGWLGDAILVVPLQETLQREFRLAQLDLGKGASRGPRVRAICHPLRCSPCARRGHVSPYLYGMERLSRGTVVEMAQTVTEVAAL